MAEILQTVSDILLPIPMAAPDVPLWMLIGLPGSGKSTWATTFVQNDPPFHLISTDQIRAQLFGDEAVQGDWMRVWRRVVQQLQQAAVETRQGRCAGAVYDATNARRRSRREVIQAVRPLGYTRILAVWFDSPISLCLQRNQQRSRIVPTPVIQTMARQLAGAPPHCDEGFVAVFRIASAPSSSPKSH